MQYSGKEKTYCSVTYHTYHCMPYQSAVERISPFVSLTIFPALAAVQAPALCSSVFKISVLMLFQNSPE